MSLSPVFRRALAGAAASIAFATGAPVSQAQSPTTQAPQSTTFAATLPEVCIPFNNTKRRQQRYDEPLGLLADKVKSFTGWPEIEAGMKAGGQSFEGLCPSTALQAAIAPIPGIRGFAINVRNPETGRGIDPALFTQAVEGGLLDPLADQTILMASALSTEYVNSPLVESDRDLETLVLLSTIRAAHAQATVITLAVERAVRDDQGTELKKFYESSPTRVAVLSDFHAVAIAARKQNRDLSDAERHAFRDKIVGIMLKDTSVRLHMVDTLSRAVAQDNMKKLNEDIEAGRPFTPRERKPFDGDYIKTRLNRFPGTLAAHADVKDYKEFWQQQRTEQQDPMVLGEEYLESLMKRLKDTQESIKQEQNNKSPRQQRVPTP